MTDSRSIHITTNEAVSFHCINVHIFCIHSFVDGYLGCFHVLAIVNIASMNMMVHMFFELWFSQGICPEWDCWVNGSFSPFLKESPYCSPQWLYQFTFPPTVQEWTLYYLAPNSLLCPLHTLPHRMLCAEVILWVVSRHLLTLQAHPKWVCELCGDRD